MLGTASNPPRVFFPERDSNRHIRAFIVPYTHVLPGLSSLNDETRITLTAGVIV